MPPLADQQQVQQVARVGQVRQRQPQVGQTAPLVLEELVRLLQLERLEHVLAERRVLELVDHAGEQRGLDLVAGESKLLFDDGREDL